jgi:hypothetical protein
LTKNRPDNQLPPKARPKGGSGSASNIRRDPPNTLKGEKRSEEVDMPTARTIADLRKATLAELVAEHDRLAVNTTAGLQYYLDEIHRRERNQSDEKMLSYTVSVRKMTAVITFLTVVMTIATLVQLWVVLKGR